MSKIADYEKLPNLVSEELIKNGWQIKKIKKDREGHYWSCYPIQNNKAEKVAINIVRQIRRDNPRMKTIQFYNMTKLKEVVLKNRTYKSNDISVRISADYLGYCDAVVLRADIAYTVE